MKNFQTKPLPRGKLRSDIVPGIDKHAICFLAESDIESVDELVAQYFFHQRDQDAFARYLQKLGINSASARLCASNLAHKLGAV